MSGLLGILVVLGISERKKEGPTRKCRAFNVSLSLGKLMLYQLSYSRSDYCVVE
jgi:hypothetical protein